ncbi:MAG: SET domain-containing protein-lysine N-methyltransferase [Chthoniobacter sp.]|nr:SET domain-containing protein-lysine N-methyltransferase [Chthoniobacter sp.]
MSDARPAAATVDHANADGGGATTGSADDSAAATDEGAAADTCAAGGASSTGSSTQLTAKMNARRRAAAARRRKAEVASTATVASSPSADDVDPPPAAHHAATIAALEASFSSLPMHEFFRPDATGTSLRFSAAKGRHVVATRLLPAGTPVFRVAPFAAVVSDAYVHAFCHHCFQTGPRMWVCSACKHARFCSATCKTAMAGVHMLECAALSRLPLLNLEGETGSIRMIMRICFLHQQEKLLQAKQQQQKQKPKNARSSWHPAPGVCFADSVGLMSHSESTPTRSKAQILLVLHELQQKVIQDEAIRRDPELDLQTLMRLLLAIQVNAHSITQSVSSSTREGAGAGAKIKIGVGLYLPAAYLNHSCDPNCAVWFDDHGFMVMQTVRALRVREELTYAYVDIYQSRTHRADALRANYFIDVCQCDKCARPLTHAASSVASGAVLTSGDALMQALVCSGCGTNPMVEFRHRCDGGTSQQPYAALKLPLLKFSNDDDAVCSACGRSYQGADLEARAHQVRLLTHQAVVSADRGDYADAVDLLEQHVLYPEERLATVGHAFLHPMHEQMFNVFLHLSAYIGAHTQQLASQLDAATATTTPGGSSTGSSPEALLESLAQRSLRAVRYVSASLECLTAQGFDTHPEAADMLQLKGEQLMEAHRWLVQLAAAAAATSSDAAAPPRGEVPRQLVRTKEEPLTAVEEAARGRSHGRTGGSLTALSVVAQEAAAAAGSATAGSSASAAAAAAAGPLLSTSLPVLASLPVAAHACFVRCAAVRAVCFGANHPSMRTVQAKVDMLQQFAAPAAAHASSSSAVRTSDSAKGGGGGGSQKKKKKNGTGKR